MLSVLAVVASLSLGAEERPALVVLEAEAKSVTPVEAAGVVTAIAQGAREVDAFQVIAPSDMRALLSIERQKQMVGLSSETTPVLEALGARHALASSVTKLGTSYQAEIRLLDVQTGKVLSQRAATPQASLSDLTTQLKVLAQEVLGPILAEQQGSLVVRSSEEGADVVVDDKLVATTPMLTPLALPRGRHRLEVRKEGFITRRTTVTIPKGDVAVEDLAMVPSADFANAWRSKHQKLRIAAWATTGLAVASFVTAFAVDRFVAEPAYQNEFRPRADFLSLAAQVEMPVATSEVQQQCAMDLAACRSKAEAARSQVASAQTASMVLLGVGVASAVAAAYCWLVGENPNRYGSGAVSLGLTPQSGGAAFSLGGTF